MLNHDTDTFRKTRTAQALLHHWNLMLQYQLLDDNIVPVSNPGSALVRKFGPENYFGFFHLLPLISPTDPTQFRHKFGLGIPPPIAWEKPMHFFDLLPQLDLLLT